MCLIALQLHEHSLYKMVLVANRDEAYTRPTASACFWKDHPQVLAGRDLLQMGTWLGITKEGRFAALTNSYDSAVSVPENPVSRGQIVSDYLTTTQSAPDFLSHLQDKHLDYAGFNLLLGDIDHLWHFNNHMNQTNFLKTGIHGLSNASLNDPWPKVLKVKSHLQQLHLKSIALDPNDLLTAFMDTSLLPGKDASFTDTTSLHLEQETPPIFIKTPEYGTVSTTVLLVDHKNNVTFIERSYSREGITGEVNYSFKIPYKIP
ncbi:NRDE family protein [Carnobacterium sp.]|uniref:NRDE family protein n=1 Tax=Carnobacterium sp. TaxID=48221 RepID=UPI003890CBB0